MENRILSFKQLEQLLIGGGTMISHYSVSKRKNGFEIQLFHNVNLLNHFKG